jgi:hypothetical protein
LIYNNIFIEKNQIGIECCMPVAFFVLRYLVNLRSQDAQEADRAACGAKTVEGRSWSQKSGL